MKETDCVLKDFSDLALERLSRDSPDLISSEISMGTFLWDVYLLPGGYTCPPEQSNHFRDIYRYHVSGQLPAI